MTAWLAIVLLGVVAVLAIAGVRRSRRRRAALLAELLGAVRDAIARLPATPTVEFLEGRLHATTPTGDVDIPPDRLLAAADRGHSPDAVAEAAILLLGAPLRPLAGPLGLKIHGPRIRPCLLPAAVTSLWPRGAPWASRPIDGLPLVATYRIDGRADACLTEDHLREQAVDTRDVHGIALAVLRQEFDEALVGRLAAGEGPQVVRTDGDHATASLLVLPDFLPPGVTVVATLERPDHLELRPLAVGATASPTPRPLPLRLRIDHRGCRIL